MDILSPVNTYVLNMLETDIFPKYMKLLLRKEQVSLSRKEALWFLHPPSFLQFFTFPNPVNVTDSRIHGLCTCFLVALTILLDYFFNFYYVTWYLAVGFILRVLCGPRLDIQSFIVLFILTPLFTEVIPLFEDKFTPGPPRHFAQFIGLIFSCVGLILRITGYQYVSWAILLGLFFASGLAGFFSYCLGCTIFGMMMKIGVIPETTCLACKSKYVL